MKLYISAFFLILFLATPAKAQWQKIEQDAYDAKTLTTNARFVQKGDTLFSVSYGNLYYSVDNGSTVNTYEEFLALTHIAIVGEQVYVSAKKELYRVNNGVFTLVATLSHEIDRIANFEETIFLITSAGVYTEVEDGFVLIESHKTYRPSEFGVVGEKFMFFGYSGAMGQYKIFYTEDGSTFADLETIPFAISNIRRVEIFDGRIYIQSNDGITSSSDGVNWATVTAAGLDEVAGAFIDIGDALIYGRPKGYYNPDEYVYMVKGDSVFKEFSVDEELGSFSRFLYKLGNRIFLLNDAQNIVAYNVSTQTWSFVKAAPFEGQYFYVGDTMILASSGGVEIHKRDFDDTYWTRTYKYITTGRGYSFTALAELPSGRLIAGLNGNSTLYYSDDKGKTWEYDPDKPNLTVQRFIARNDTIFAGSSNSLYMSIDNAETWTEVLNRLNANNIKFIGNNSILAERKVYSLSDFSVEKSINTNEGAIQDYDTLNGYEYKGTNSGLYGKEISSSKWTVLTSRLASGLTQTNVLGIIAYQEVIVAVTSAGVFYSSNDGDSFNRVGNEIRSTRSYFVKDNMLYVNAYNDFDQAFGFYKVDMERMEPLPVLETLEENTQVRVDTLINLNVKALVQPRNFEVSVNFEYGEVTTGEFVFTHSTSPKTYTAQEEPFEAEGVIPGLEASRSYRYRAILTYNDTSKVIGEDVFVRTKSKKLWSRLDPTDLGGDFRDVLVTKRGSIIAWGASGTIRSIDNGKTWRELEEGRGIYSMIRAGGNRLFAGTTSGKFMYSFTEGMTWKLTENKNLPSVFGGNTRISDITFDSPNSIIYALIGEHEASTNNAVYLIKSTDSGNSWTTLLTSLVPNGGLIRDIHADSSGTLWVTSDAPLANNNMIIKSTDFGETWETVLKSEGNTTKKAYEMLQVGRDTLYVNTTMGAYYSVDGGETFSFAKDKDGNIIPYTGSGNKYAFSEKHGLVSVANIPNSSQFESGSVSISSLKGDALDFVSTRVVNYFGDDDEKDMRNNNKMIVRNTYVSNSDMILIATNNGVWRYIPSSDSLFENPDPKDISISNEEEIDEAQTFTLFQNYPNPFNPTTIISFQLPKASDVTVKVYDITGREVATLLANKKLTGGTHTLSYNASNLSSGIYLYKISAGKFSQVRKMTLIK